MPCSAAVAWLPWARASPTGDPVGVGGGIGPPERLGQGERRLRAERQGGSQGQGGEEDGAQHALDSSLGRRAPFQYYTTI